MNRFVLIISIFLAVPLASAAQVSFEGNTLKALEFKPEASTGLNSIYVLSETLGVNLVYQASDADVTVERYTNLGGAYAQPVAASVNGKTYTVALGADDAGYIITDGSRKYCCWVVNYANHECRIASMDIAPEQECDRARLAIDGSADKITYFSITGVGKELSRDIEISYYTLRYDDEQKLYTQVQASSTYPSIEHSVGVPAPLCDTRFTLTADRFLRAWGTPLTVESGQYNAIAVEARTLAEQALRENDNEQNVDAESLGGSAPADITFSAEVTDAAIFREWQLASDAEFENVIDRFQQLEFTYTFRNNGSYFVRFVANNSAGTCEFVGETYDITIGESDLLCPNVFSPNGDGVNDEWKVSYKSIVEFECHIFNRWGEQMCSFTDPGRGWDGRHKGKYVPAGVYYYVIKARGSDGRKYNLSGDINIIKSKYNTPASSGDE